MTACRCCKNRNLLLYLNLGKQPLANSYHKGEYVSLYPLEVYLCQNCFHSQLGIVVDPEKMFKNYLYVSGTTDTFKKHCKDLAEDAVKRINKKELHVLDIACNDGTLLAYFKEMGCRVFGVDPAQNLRGITQKKNIPVLVDYWGTHMVKKISQKFNLITGTNVFAHVDNLDDFLKSCFLTLEDDGMLILEFPYCNKMIAYNEFDTVYHEHLSYFLVNSFATLTTRMNFSIVDVLQTPIHGGSIRFILKKGETKHCKKVIDLIRREKQRGLFAIQTYNNFAKQVDKNRKSFQTLVSKLQKSKKKVIGYGASAKGNTMLNYFKIDLDYIVDDNSLKWGLLTPGRNIPIESPSALKKEQESLFIVILSWNFYKAIVKQLKKLREKKFHDHCILYVPKVTSILLHQSNDSLLTV